MHGVGSGLLKRDISEGGYHRSVMGGANHWGVQCRADDRQLLEPQPVKKSEGKYISNDLYTETI